MSEILRSGTANIQRSDPELHEALVRMQSEVIAVRDQLGVLRAVAGESGGLLGPYPFTGTLRPGNAVWIVRGRLTPTINDGGWMGEHAIGVVSRIDDKQAWVKTVGLIEAECVEASAVARLAAGTAMFVSGSKGHIASGWPKDGKNVYQIGHVVGKHKTHRVMIDLKPMPLMRFG